MKPQVVIELTDEQAELLEPIMEQVRAAVAEGKKGIAIGQINPFSTTMPDKVYFAFFPHELAAEVQKILAPKQWEIWEKRKHDRR